MWIIRQAKRSDVATLPPMVRAYWNFERITGFVPRRVAASIARLLSDPRLGAGWIAFQDDCAAGYLLAVYVFSLEYGGRTAEVDELFVAPEYRGKGVGQGLLACAEAEFARAGCANVSLQVSRGNDAARSFYCNLGYAPRAGFELLDKQLQNS